MKITKNTIVAATRNRHKIAEIENITKEFGMNIVSRDEAGVPAVEIEEDGETFEENSCKKAREIMELCGAVTIADDSGLEIDCLGGAPGVYSARFSMLDDEYAGITGILVKDGTDEDTDRANNEKVRRLLKDVPEDERGARFVSVITMVFPDGETIVARGSVEGRLVTEERGENGFGYDPLFVPDGYDETFGELSSDVKNRISHRASALRALRDRLSERERS